MRKKRFIVYLTLTIFCLTSVFPMNVFSQQRFNEKDLSRRIVKLSQEIAKEIIKNQKISIAVVDFTDLQDKVTDNGRILAEELTTRLCQTQKFKVIERQLLKKVITEQKFSLSGVVDPASAKRLGKILGVDAIVCGTVVEIEKTIRVNARLINTETGEIFAAASTTIKGKSTIPKEPPIGEKFWSDICPWIGLAILLLVIPKEAWRN